MPKGVNSYSIYKLLYVDIKSVVQKMEHLMFSHLD